jgi:hypothetical protein
LECVSGQGYVILHRINDMGLMAAVGSKDGWLCTRSVSCHRGQCSHSWWPEPYPIPVIPFPDSSWHAHICWGCSPHTLDCFQKISHPILGHEDLAGLGSDQKLVLTSLNTRERTRFSVYRRLGRESTGKISIALEAISAQCPRCLRPSRSSL